MKDRAELIIEKVMEELRLKRYNAPFVKSHVSVNESLIDDLIEETPSEIPYRDDLTS